MTWAVYRADDGIDHVIPTGENHNTEPHKCWCRPKLVEGIWVHHQVDDGSADVYATYCGRNLN